jgi:hypothetical protein
MSNTGTGSSNNLNAVYDLYDADDLYDGSTLENDDNENQFDMSMSNERESNELLNDTATVAKSKQSNTAPNNQKKASPLYSKNNMSGSHANISNLALANMSNVAHNSVLNLNSLTPNYNQASSGTKESRLSLSIERFGQGLLSKTELSNMSEAKRKSQPDLMNMKASGLSNSMYNMSRSSSLNCNDLEANIDLKRINQTNKSLLNGIFKKSIFLLSIINLKNK